MQVSSYYLFKNNYLCIINPQYCIEILLQNTILCFLPDKDVAPKHLLEHFLFSQIL